MGYSITGLPTGCARSFPKRIFTDYSTSVSLIA